MQSLAIPLTKYSFDCAPYLLSGAGFGSHTLVGSTFAFLTLPRLDPQGNTQFRSHYFPAEFFPARLVTSLTVSTNLKMV